MSFFLASRAWSLICSRVRVASIDRRRTCYRLNTSLTPRETSRVLIAMDRNFSTTSSRDACGCAAGARISSKRTAYIALGSNLGDRVAMIEQACREMDAREIRVKRTSSLWETEPMYVLDQDRFVNGACEVRFNNNM